MTPGIFPDTPEYTVLTSSFGAVVEMPGEAALFCSHAGVLGWTEHFGIAARDFLRKYERATSCNHPVSMTTRVQRSGELPLKMPPDHSLEVNS